MGKKRWRQHVAEVVVRLSAALHPDDIVIGGGNVKKIKTLPPGCRAGDNALAFLGGFRLWEEARDRSACGYAQVYGDTPAADSESDS
jgi:polyphosphate glucokinase